MSKAMKKRAILIAGPTASGKSETALRVAEKLAGEIINADSMQVYEGLPILTALPEKQETEKIPHHLYGFREATGGYSVADWLGEAGATVKAVWDRGKIPVFAGGTGLYFKGLVEGIAPIPEVPEYIKLAFSKRLEKEGLPSLFEDLKEVDPKIAKRLKANDKQRILRALMVFEVSKKPLSFWQARDQEAVLKGTDLLKIVLQSPPDELNELILERLGRMIDRGALAEVETFSGRHLARHLPITKVLGLRPFQAHLRGEITLNEALEKAMIETRQYAKRQRTWFRNQFPGWTPVKAGPDAARDILSLAKDEWGV